MFVQFPENCIDDATGVWLKAYVLDGIQYILSFSGPDTESVIINLSYGPTTGPHDGTALLEEALSALVTEFNGTANNPKLEIFLAAGNSYLTEGRVTFKRDEGQPGQIEWIWRLPPDNPVLCFSEVWMKTVDASGVTVTLTPPGGGAAMPISPLAWGNNTMWQLNVGPTIVAPLINPAPHGDYTIKVSGIAVGARLDAYVARTDPNLSVRSLAKPSHFVDLKWLQTRSAEADCIYADGEFDNDGSLVDRYGTLNGIATAQNPSVHVAGGDMLAVNGRKSPYSSAGPTRGGARIGPDYALFCDEFVCPRRCACRWYQERCRVSPDRHQHCGTATGTTGYERPASGADRRPAQSAGKRAPRSRQYRTALMQRRTSRWFRIQNYARARQRR